MHSLLRLTAKSKIEARPPGQFCEAELKLTNYDGDVFTGCSLVELNEPEAARIVAELLKTFPRIAIQAIQNGLEVKMPPDWPELPPLEPITETVRQLNPEVWGKEVAADA